MENELVKVDPNEFGLGEKKANELTVGLKTILQERELLKKEYEKCISMEITEKNIPVFKKLRLQIRDNRTKGIENWHKANKAYFLAGGRFVDAIKNKECADNTRMEEKLMDGEKYFENLEKERIEALASEREAEIRKYSDVVPYDLGNMDQSVYDNYLTGVKVAMESRLKAEKEAEEERVRLEKIEKLNTERKNKTIRLVEFIDDYENLSFGEMSEKDFMSLVNGAIKKRTAHEAEQEAIRKENERLKKEAEAEAKRRAKEEQERKAKEEAARKKQEEKDRLEREEREKLQAELQAKKDAEIAAQKAKEDAERREREEAEKAAKAPRKERLTKWVNSFTLPEFGDDDVAMEISTKFDGFKKWAKGEVEKV